MGKSGRFVVGLIFPALFLEQEHSDTNSHHWVGGAESREKKAKYSPLEGLCWSREAKQAARENPGKVFCGFPAGPAEFAVLWGLGELLRAQDHIPTLLCSTSAPCSVSIFGGSWRLKSPSDQQGNNLPKAAKCCGKRGVCFAAPPCLDFSLCLALQE